MDYIILLPEIKNKKKREIYESARNSKAPYYFQQDYAFNNYFLVENIKNGTQKLFLQFCDKKLYFLQKGSKLIVSFKNPLILINDTIERIKKKKAEFEQLSKRRYKNIFDKNELSEDIDKLNINIYKLNKLYRIANSNERYNYVDNDINKIDIENDDIINYCEKKNIELNKLQDKLINIKDKIIEKKIFHLKDEYIKLILIVKQIRLYKSIEECLNAEGLTNLYPNINDANYVIDYYNNKLDSSKLQSLKAKYNDYIFSVIEFEQY